MWTEVMCFAGMAEVLGPPSTGGPALLAGATVHRGPTTHPRGHRPHWPHHSMPGPPSIAAPPLPGATVQRGPTMALLLTTSPPLAGALAGATTLQEASYHRYQGRRHRGHVLLCLV